VLFIVEIKNYNFILRYFIWHTRSVIIVLQPYLTSYLLICDGCWADQPWVTNPANQRHRSHHSLPSSYPQVTSTLLWVRHELLDDFRCYPWIQLDIFYDLNFKFKDTLICVLLINMSHRQVVRRYRRGLSGGVLQSFSDFQKAWGRRNATTVGELFGMQLRQVPGCSSTVSKAIVDKYGTLYSLMKRINEAETASQSQVSL